MSKIKTILSIIFIFTIWGCVSSAYPILLWWSRECVLYLIIIIKPEVWIINHCLGLGHETMVCAVCLTMFLLDKLLYYGIKGTELAWFKSYLTNRTQFVSYNGTNSRILTITTGVPQGSISGPLLFIIYMNDIHNASSKFHAILFADDTNLTSTLCSFDVNIDNNCNSL